MWQQHSQHWEIMWFGAAKTRKVAQVYVSHTKKTNWNWSQICITNQPIQEVPENNTAVNVVFLVSFSEWTICCITAAILLEKWSPATRDASYFSFQIVCNNCTGSGSLIHSRYVMIQFIIQFLPPELPHCSEGLDVQESVAQTHVAAAHVLFLL